MTRKQVGNSSKRDGTLSVHTLRSRAKLKSECGRYLSSTWEPRSGERTEEPSTGDIICAARGFISRADEVAFGTTVRACRLEAQGFSLPRGWYADG
jgi:hypothetical protein